MIQTYINKWINEAKNLADQFGIPVTGNNPLGHNDERDAFRHAYTSAMMAYQFGETAAWILGDLNEIVHQDKNTKETNMDAWNNNIGREIGLKAKSAEEIAQKVYEALQNGQLIKDLSDTRDYYLTYKDKIEEMISLFTGSSMVFYLREELLSIWSSVNSLWLSARNFFLRRDPLAIDLDGDGIETIGINGYSTVTFDFDGDGIRTGTGWVAPDDGLLVMDRNGNGVIDNGSELFGVDTVLSNGTKAPDGLTALRDLDTNQDNIFDSSDTQFNNVRVWRDVNQDGISQEEELKSLSDTGITSISLNPQEIIGDVNRALYNGNEKTSTSQVSGITGKAYNLNLASNPFYSEFTDTVPLTEQAKTLPEIQGAGMVRDLQEAASISSSLASTLETVKGVTTRAGIDKNFIHSKNIFNGKYLTLDTMSRIQ